MSLAKRTYNGILVGDEIRGSIGGDTTFRVRRGNGYYNSILGHRYQDRFTLVIPSSINNAQSEPYRTLLRAGIIHWQYALTDAEKKEYNHKASHGLRMSGYNLFIREVLTGKVPMFVDRGDPATYDKVKTDLNTDGTWRDLDLSSIIPSGAKAVLLKTSLESAGIGDAIRYRKNGISNEINACGCEAIRANVERTRLTIVALDIARVIEYNADNIAWTTLSIVVRGWWM